MYKDIVLKHVDDYVDDKKDISEKGLHVIRLGNHGHLDYPKSDMDNNIVVDLQQRKQRPKKWRYSPKETIFFNYVIKELSRPYDGTFGNHQSNFTENLGKGYLSFYSPGNEIYLNCFSAPRGLHMEYAKDDFKGIKIIYKYLTRMILDKHLLQPKFEKNVREIING